MEKNNNNNTNKYFKIFPAFETLNGSLYVVIQNCDAVKHI